jgi:hypothetical protein
MTEASNYPIAATDLKQHPLSAAFPSMTAEEFQMLKDSVDNAGVLNPITIFDGMVIDGWHRYRAAKETGVDCPCVELADTDPQDFVMAQNKTRRHITLAQLVLATALVYQWRQVGNPGFSLSRTECGIAKSTAVMAGIAGVGQRSMEQGKAIATSAAPEIFEAINRGDIGLPKAAAISKLPKSEQAAALKKPLPKPIAKPAPVVEAEPEGPDYTELDAAHDQVQDLQAMLAVANLNSTESEEQAQAATLIAELRAYIKSLESMNKQLTISRDTLQNEAAHLKQNVLRLQRLSDRQDNKKAVQS